MRKGFTLVELSIVLVIIGLLIGGILVGQSMMDTARIQNFVRQVYSYDVAVSNFRTKYNSLPGDTTFFPNPGNGNNKIEDSGNLTGNAYGLTFTAEESNFWTHLSEAGFMPDSVIYSNSATSGLKTGVNSPTISQFKSVLGRPASVLPYRDTGLFPNPTYFFADFSPSTGTTYNNAGAYSMAFTPIQLLAIDLKMDDGKQGWGGIVSGYDPTGSGKCFSGTAYLVNNNLECILFIRMLSQQGGLPN